MVAKFIAVLAFTTSSFAGHTCCTALHQILGRHVSFPGQTQYNLTESSYDARQEADIRPSCILRPTTRDDVARAISILTSYDNHNGCQFAIKGGGHSPAAGSANIKNGVTIDMTSLTSIELSLDNSVAMVGAGGTWVQVYQSLTPHNIIVAGGRNGNVGVGGLLIGGGISHFSGRVGWACDNVVNYEVVLSNGTSVCANHETNADLFLALKGGSNNFGIVTRFDLATFPQGNISSTRLFHDGSHIPTVLKAFTSIITSVPFDMDASLVTSLIYNSTSKGWTVLNIAVYTKPVANPPVFSELFSIPNISSETAISSPAQISIEAQGPPSNTMFATATFRPSLELMLDMFHIMDDFFRAFAPPAGSVDWVVGFEPVVAGLIEPKPGMDANVLGLSPDNKGFLILLSPSWTNKDSTGAVEDAAARVLSLLESHAESKGLLQMFQYLNYASPRQKPLRSYGEDNLQFLRRVGERYDPGRIFQDKVPGGFKLRS